MRTVGPKDYVAPGETVYVEGTGMTYTNSLGTVEDFLGLRRCPIDPPATEDTLP